MKNNKNTQPSLPFIDLTSPDGRNAVREVSISRAERLHVVDIKNISLRPGLNRKYFNWRIQPEGMSDELYEIQLGIPKLATDILNSGAPDDPLVGDFKDGTFYINGGERRYRAIKYLLQTQGEDATYPNGQPIRQVEVLQNPKGYTDKDRIRRIHSSDNNLKYSTMERAYGYLEMKDDFSMTHEEIANELQISRQTVDNYIMATTLPKEVQSDIDEGKTNISTALKELRTARRIASDDIDEQLLPNERKEKEEKEAGGKIRGDEDDFKDQDNTVPGVSSMGGPKETGSGAHVVGKDSIYLDAQKLALFRQFVNRYEVVKHDILMSASLENGYLKNWEDELATRLKNEYNLTVK